MKELWGKKIVAKIIYCAATFTVCQDLRYSSLQVIYNTPQCEDLPLNLLAFKELAYVLFSISAQLSFYLVKQDRLACLSMPTHVARLITTSLRFFTCRCTRLYISICVFANFLSPHSSCLTYFSLQTSIFTIRTHAIECLPLFGCCLFQHRWNIIHSLSFCSAAAASTCSLERVNCQFNVTLPA